MAVNGTIEKAVENLVGCSWLLGRIADELAKRDDGLALAGAVRSVSAAVTASALEVESAAVSLANQ